MLPSTLPALMQLSIEKPVSLHGDELHIYVVSVGELLGQQDSLRRLINKDEEVRASRFINPQHGDNYRCIRGQLRKLLGFYLAMPATDVPIHYSEHGKPYLNMSTPLKFNLSHSHDMAAFIFSQKSDVGIDIEYMRKLKNLPGMIRHVASEKERLELDKLDGNEIFEAFYRLWTRKEAVVKASGRGLGMGLRSIYVGTHPAPSYLPVEYQGQVKSEWQTLDLTPPNGFKLAVCTCKEE